MHGAWHVARSNGPYGHGRWWWSGGVCGSLAGVEHNENTSQMRDISINDMDPGPDGSRIRLSGHIGLIGLVPRGPSQALDGRQVLWLA